MRDYTSIETLCLKFCKENSELSERIEKLEKAIKILKDKIEIFEINDGLFVFGQNFLTQNEVKFLKEVFEEELPSDNLFRHDIFI